MRNPLRKAMRALDRVGTALGIDPEAAGEALRHCTTLSSLVVDDLVMEYPQYLAELEYGDRLRLEYMTHDIIHSLQTVLMRVATGDVQLTDHLERP